MRRRYVLISLFLLGTNLGCSDQAPDMPELGQVHGTVTLDGKPLEGVSVLFEPQNGRPSTAITDSAGEYEAQYLIDEPGVKLGPNTVRVEWGIDATGPKIPAKYGAKSELKLDVQAGDNEFAIDMKSK